MTRMESFDTHSGLLLGLVVFSSALQVSTNVQAKNITTQEETRATALLTSQMDNLRTDAKFYLLFLIKERKQVC